MKFLQCIVFLCIWTAGEAEFVDYDATCTTSNGQCVTRCTCNEGYTDMDEQCFAKVGRSCATNTDCVPDASCTGSTGSQTCQCPNSLVPSFYDTKCKFKVGAECKDSSDCMIHSECRTGTCACMDKYAPSSDNKTCIGYVGAECDDISQCIEHAECSGGKCKCTDDYEEDKNCQKKDSLPLPLWAIILISVGGGLLVEIFATSCICRKCHNNVAISSTFPDALSWNV
ncbi:TEN2-like protein [Mya arenaria]|uniref:TEN2-like protein n=1 Tax=Mya arenaria TaxID=6604 RepID=A0ABY7G279_MYAAR|nr:TEN2-like protein [Mya arenaria]